MSAASTALLHAEWEGCCTDGGSQPSRSPLAFLAQVASRVAGLVGSSAPSPAGVASGGVVVGSVGPAHESDLYDPHWEFFGPPPLLRVPTHSSCRERRGGGPPVDQHRHRRTSGRLGRWSLRCSRRSQVQWRHTRPPLHLLHLPNNTSDPGRCPGLAAGGGAVEGGASGRVAGARSAVGPLHWAVWQGAGEGNEARTHMHPPAPVPQDQRRLAPRRRRRAPSSSSW